MTGPYESPALLSAAPAAGAVASYNGVTGLWDPNQPAPLRPTGSARESCSRQNTALTDESAVLATGVLSVAAIELFAGDVVNNLNFVSGATAESGGSHCWAALLDSGRHVLAVSADNTGGTFFANHTAQAFAMGSAYDVTATGLYYAAIAVVGTPPSLLCKHDGTADVLGIAPILAATSDGSLTTPPAVGHQFGALTAVANLIYAYTS